MILIFVTSILLLSRYAHDPPAEETVHCGLQADTMRDTNSYKVPVDSSCCVSVLLHSS